MGVPRRSGKETVNLLLSKHWGIVTLRPHAVNIGQYRIAAIAGDCKSLPSGSWVRVPVLARG